MSLYRMRAQNQWLTRSCHFRAGTTGTHEKWHDRARPARARSYPVPMLRRFGRARSCLSNFEILSVVRRSWGSWERARPMRHGFSVGSGRDSKRRKCCFSFFDLELWLLSSLTLLIKVVVAGFKFFVSVFVSGTDIVLRTMSITYCSSYIIWFSE